MSEELIENIDYYFDESGLMVFTKEYHLKRGYCCGNNCLNCPWRNNKSESENESEGENENECENNKS